MVVYIPKKGAKSIDDSTFVNLNVPIFNFNPLPINLAVKFLHANNDPNNVSKGYFISKSSLLKFKFTFVDFSLLTPVHPNVLIVPKYNNGDEEINL